jgi:hypothetical protein
MLMTVQCLSVQTKEVLSREVEYVKFQKRYGHMNRPEILVQIIPPVFNHSPAFSEAGYETHNLVSDKAECVSVHVFLNLKGKR